MTASPLTETLRIRAAAMLGDVAPGAARREQVRDLPLDWVRDIGRHQLLTWRIPQTYGGPGVSVREVVQWVIDLAAVDSNVAQALRPSYLLIEALLLAEDEGLRERWLPHFLAGKVFGNAGWEVGGANGNISSSIVPEGDGFRVSGSKYYSTGALYADWISAAAIDEHGQVQRFIVPTDREGLLRKDDFDAMGQRLTASGTTEFNHVWVARDELIPDTLFALGPNERSIVTPFAQLFLAAVEAGIARNALTDAVYFAQHHARPIKHSTAQQSVDDPYVAYSVGDIAAHAFSAQAAVLAAADRIDAAWRLGLTQDAINMAAVDVAQAQYIAAEAALRAGEWLFDVGSASATARGHNLDRHWRNARTVANHNPRHWKAAAVGSFYLKGTPPPFSGLF